MENQRDQRGASPAGSRRRIGSVGRWSYCRARPLRRRGSSPQPEAEIYCPLKLDLVSPQRSRVGTVSSFEGDVVAVYFAFLDRQGRIVAAKEAAACALHASREAVPILPEREHRIA